MRRRSICALATLKASRVRRIGGAEARVCLASGISGAPSVAGVEAVSADAHSLQRPSRRWVLSYRDGGPQRHALSPEMPQGARSQAGRKQSPPVCCNSFRETEDSPPTHPNLTPPSLPCLTPVSRPPHHFSTPARQGPPGHAPEATPDGGAQGPRVTPRSDLVTSIGLNIWNRSPHPGHPRRSLAPRPVAERSS